MHTTTEIPNATTRKAMAELEVGKGKKFTSVNAMMAELNAEAIREKLGDLEDLAIAEQRTLAIREGRSKTIPLETVMKKYGLKG